MKHFLLNFLLTGILGLIAAGNTFGQVVYNWKGNSTTWESASSWTLSNGSTPSVYPGQSGTTDIVQFGVTGSFTNQPTLSSTITVGSITFGSSQQAGTNLTVNSGAILTAGTITQNENTGGSSSTVYVDFYGSGEIDCSDIVVGTNGGGTGGSFNIMITDINILRVANNVTLYSNVNKGTGTGFRLENGTMYLGKQIIIPSTSGINVNNASYFTINTDVRQSSSSPTTPTLYLASSNVIPSIPIPYASINFYGDRATGGVGNVIYTGASPVIYTTAVTGFGAGGGVVPSTPSSTYDNLTIAGTGTATVGNSTAAGTLWTTGNFTTSSPVNFLSGSTAQTTTTIGGSWTNTSTVSLGSGTTTVTGALSNSSPANLTMSSGSLTVGGNYTNSAGSAFTAGAGTFYFNGSSAQALADNSTGGTIFNNVDFNGGGAKTLSGSTGFAVSNIGNLTMEASTTLNTAGELTLMSNASGTASVASIPSTALISGNVNVQRYISGGATYRGYRLMSSPVNISSNTAGAGNLSLFYLNVNQSFAGVSYTAALTAGIPGPPHFSMTNINPIIYLYDETRPTDNSTFVAGKNVGIYDITGNTVTTLSGKPAVQTTGVSIPVGNGFLFYFLGNNTVGTLKSTSPPTATVTSVGYLNQGNVPVVFWKSKSTSIPYDVTLDLDNPLITVTPGYNQVGNPYASTISLDQVYTDNIAISVPNALLSPIFWEMNGVGSTYIAYNGKTHTASNGTTASKYIVSGQGFIIDATTAGQTLTFKEDQKVTYPAGFTATSSPALLLAVKPQPSSVLSGLHLQLSKDTVTKTQTGIYFNSEWADTFNNLEDALDLDGASPVVYLSSYSSDGKRLCINQLNTIGKGKIIKLFVNSTASGQYNISLADIQNVDTVYNIYLRDHYKKDSLDIGRYHNYVFDITKSDTNSFGSTRFDLAIRPRPLAAYRLNLFTAQKVTGGVKISWNTSNEGDYTGFVLQKMKNGVVQYLTLDSLQSDGRGDYYYIDNSPNTAGNNTYRLQQNDVNAVLSYSPTINVNYVNSGNSMMLYPNPAKESIQLVMDSSNPSQSTSNISTIYNSSGAVVAKKTIFGSTWSHDISNLMPGVYTVQVIDNTGKLSGNAKFVKVQ